MKTFGLGLFIMGAIALAADEGSQPMRGDVNMNALQYFHYYTQYGECLDIEVTPKQAEAHYKAGNITFPNKGRCHE